MQIGRSGRFRSAESRTVFAQLNIKLDASEAIDKFGEIWGRYVRLIQSYLLYLYISTILLKVFAHLRIACDEFASMKPECLG